MCVGGLSGAAAEAVVCAPSVGVRPKARPRLKRGPTVSHELCVFTQVVEWRVPRSRNHLLTKRTHKSRRPALAGGNMCFSAMRVQVPTTCVVIARCVSLRAGVFVCVCVSPRLVTLSCNHFKGTHSVPELLTRPQIGKWPHLSPRRGNNLAASGANEPERREP